MGMIDVCQHEPRRRPHSALPWAAALLIAIGCGRAQSPVPDGSVVNPRDAGTQAGAFADRAGSGGAGGSDAGLKETLRDAGAAGASAGAGGGGARAGIGGVGGQAGALAAGSMADVPPGICPGASLPQDLVGSPPCSSSRECEGGWACVLARPVFECGGAAPPPPECAIDADCGADKICETFSCSRVMCIDACPAVSCPSHQRCEQGRCIDRRCDDPQGGACGIGYMCQSSAGGNGCVASRCDHGNLTCPLPMACSPGTAGADEHSCRRPACTRHADCVCGACVDGLCAPRLGACANISPPP
jgi:hypothetical protein